MRVTGPFRNIMVKARNHWRLCAFSFFSNKNISTGEGGMFISNNKEMAEKARLLRSHGMTTMSYQRASGHATAYDIVELGYNFRLDDIRASIAIEQLKKLPSDLEKRIAVRKRYVQKLSAVKGLIIPFADSIELSSNYIMPVVLADTVEKARDQVREIIHAAGYTDKRTLSCYSQILDIQRLWRSVAADGVCCRPRNNLAYVCIADPEAGGFIVETVNGAVNDK